MKTYHIIWLFLIFEISQQKRHFRVNHEEIERREKEEDDRRKRRKLIIDETDKMKYYCDGHLPDFEELLFNCVYYNISQKCFTE